MRPEDAGDYTLVLKNIAAGIEKKLHFILTVNGNASFFPSFFLFFQHIICTSSPFTANYNRVTQDGADDVMTFLIYVYFMHFQLTMALKG